MKCKTYEEAKEQAQRNANQTGVTWIAFFDTSGNPRCERYNAQIVECEFFVPEGGAQ